MDGTYVFPARTFRIGNIPAGTTAKQLEDVFHVEDRKFLQIKSLVPAVDNHDLNGEQTATVLYRPQIESNQRPRLLDDDITMDDHFHGLTPLYQPTGPISADVIAITGLAGHAFGSWAHSKSKMWLRDYLPKDLPNVRVLIYGYKSTLQANKARSIFADYSVNFVNRLKAMRTLARCEDRPIVLIGHSLGCLIIKNALVEFNDSNRPEMRLPVRSVIFFGAPHKGLETKALELLVESEPSEDLIKELKPGSPTLRTLNDRFYPIANDISILSCYEKVSTKTPIKTESGEWKREGEERLMVTYDSATLYTVKETRVGCDDDHSQIAKIRRDEGGVWYAIKAALQKAVEEEAAPFAATSSLPIRSTRGIQDVPSTINTLQAPSHLAPSNPSPDPHRDNNVQNRQETPDTEATGIETPVSELQMELCSAIRIGNIDTVQRLMANGAHVHTPHEDSVDVQQDPFLLAAWFRQKRVLEILVRYNPDPKKNLLDEQCTALHLIFYPSGSDSRGPLTASLVALLLRSGCDIEARDQYGQTPLLCAARSGNVEIVCCLVDHGADHEAISDLGFGVIHMAAYDDERLEVLKFFISRGVFLEKKSDEGFTPLMISARRGQLKNVRWLLDHGANVSHHNKYGWTALHYAKYYGHPQIVEMLLRYSADPCAQTHQGLKPSEVEWANETNLKASEMKRIPSEEAKALCLKLLRDAEKA